MVVWCNKFPLQPQLPPFICLLSYVRKSSVFAVWNGAGEGGEAALAKALFVSNAVVICSLSSQFSSNDRLSVARLTSTHARLAVSFSLAFGVALMAGCIYLSVAGKAKHGQVAVTKTSTRMQWRRTKKSNDVRLSPVMVKLFGTVSRRKMDGSIKANVVSWVEQVASLLISCALT